MSLPIYWAGQSVNNPNLQDTTAGPWARVVDAALAANTGRNYKTLQAAWDAASPGDSIFVKAGSYSSGLQVSAASGNNKDGIRLVGENTANLGSDGAPAISAIVQISDCNNLTLENLLVEGSADYGYKFENVTRYSFLRLHARSCATSGFIGIQLSNGEWVRCTSRSNAAKGFSFYDGVQFTDWIRCEAYNNGDDGFQFSDFPVSNTWCAYNSLVACRSYNNTGSADGFSVRLGSPASGANGWSHLAILGCSALGNAGEGFYLIDISASTAAGIRVADCNAVSNGNYGYRLSGFAASNPTCSFHGNQHAANTTGGYSGMPATLLPGYIGNGLTAPGTNR